MTNRNETAVGFTLPSGRVTSAPSVKTLAFFLWGLRLRLFGFLDGGCRGQRDWFGCQLFADFGFDLVGQFRICPQQVARVLTALADSLAVGGVPCPELLAAVVLARHV